MNLELNHWNSVFSSFSLGIEKELKFMWLMVSIIWIVALQVFSLFSMANRHEEKPS